MQHRLTFSLQCPLANLAPPNPNHLNFNLTLWYFCTVRVYCCIQREVRFMEGCAKNAHAGNSWELDSIQRLSGQPQLVQRPETFVMGIELRANRTQPSTDQFSQLWTRFLAEQMQLEIADSISAQRLYGLYTDYSCDCREYSLILATEVSSIDNPLEGMVGIAIPAGCYLRFAAEGAAADTAPKIWPQIWRYFEAAPYQRAFTADFELYEPQQTSIYIAVKACC